MVQKFSDAYALISKCDILPFLKDAMLFSAVLSRFVAAARPKHIREKRKMDKSLLGEEVCTQSDTKQRLLIVGILNHDLELEIHYHFYSLQYPSEQLTHGY